MSRQSLTGSRIRDKRLDLGQKQAALAHKVGISAAYLNLIEHNKRRIGGKLLLDLARELSVDPSTLSEGAAAQLLTDLQDAASGQFAGQAVEAADLRRVDEFARKFPEWANLVVDQHRKCVDLQHNVQALTDRIAHDPHLSESLHELLSAVTAIRSTASILVGEGDIDPVWQQRFQKNLHEDAKRLAHGAQGLVAYLDVVGQEQTGQDHAGHGTPQDALESYLAAQGYHLQDEEGRDPQEVDGYLQRYRQDALDLPLQDFGALVQDHIGCPAQMAGQFGVDIAKVLRRIAVMPTATGQAPVGLISCDITGTLTFRKPIEGFSVPHHGAPCALWPIYQALAQPHVPVRVVVEQSGHDAPRFLTYSIAQIHPPKDFSSPPIVEATMLIIPETRANFEAGAEVRIGSSCRVCPRASCNARRDPSLLDGDV